MTPRLLLVEDDPITCTFLHTATLELGYAVDVAGSIQQALALAGTTDYSAWLLDARLPDGSAVELLQRLRARAAEVPALVHTANVDQAEMQRLRASGFDLAVHKPLSAADWQAAVRMLLAAQAAPQSNRVATPSSGPLWDDAAALKVIGGDAATLAALRQLFFDELPDSLQALEHASIADDHAGIHASLHRLSASCGFVGAARLAAAIGRWRSDPDTLHTVISVARETLASRHSVERFF